ncbi:ladinin-1-like [Bos indicus x Bos taurus]|uniref:ladinin-1-like n=1 Tax=Bos indicus x Bos taurus TaxID=30522 RepID=UPI000F7D3BE4|nr:ladinin-1-like [Bos indicus x Bos taurus]
MSVSRKSWAALSSLTRQSTLEDEEEQEREHQWQHQNLSFAMDDKDPPDPESTSVRLPASSVKLGPKLEQYLSAIQRSESVKCANPSHTEFLEAPVDVASKRQLFEKELVGQNREGPAASCKENLELSGLVKSRLRWISRIQESAQQGPQNQETQRELAAGRKPQWRKKPEAPLGAKISVLEERAVSGKREVPDKASDSEKRQMSEKATVFKKTPVPEIQPAPGRAMAPLRPQDWEHSASAECPSSPGGQRGTGPEKEPESSAGPLSRDGGLPPVTLQVRTRSTEAEAKAPSPTRVLPPFSSTLQCSSTRTIPRMSPPRDSSEVALTHSTSMRLPASSVKLGQKLEQYLSTIQRSESVKCANPSHTEFLEAPVDVASKRQLFEKELVGQNREGPAASCKENLELSGLVKSRLRWISRIQESAQQGPQNQETQRELAAGRKPQWRKKPEAPLGAKISVLEERAVSGKREVPDKASDSEKRQMSEKATVFKKTPVPEIQPAPGRAMAPLRPQDWEHSASAECPSSPGGQRGTGPEKEPESSAGPLSRDGGLPPVTLQVRTRSTEAEAKAPSPTRVLPPFSSTLQCSSTRTIPRMSPPRDSSEVALTHSTSMRLPASSVKLRPKLEQYLLAIQRSESVKCANPSCTDFLEAPVDVSSMRHLFEKELVGQSREGPASRHKENLQLSGVVKSQLKLWNSRIQESAQQVPQNQEMQRDLAAGRRPQWRKKPEPRLGP